MSHSLLARPGSPVASVLPAAAISSRAWDALVEPAGFYSSPEWVLGLESAHGPHSALAATSAGRLIGLVPTWKNAAPTGLFSLPAMTAPLRGDWTREVLWLGTARGTANTVTCTRDPHLRGPTLKALVDLALEQAVAQGRTGVVWPYLSGPAAREVAACHPLAQAVLHGADPVMTVPRGGMAELEARAGGKQRRAWRRERRLFRASCSSLEWTSLSPEVCELIGPLLAGTRDKYGGSGGTAWMQRVLAGQITSGVAHQAVVALARTNSDVSAAAVFYRHRGWLYGRYWGATSAAPQYAYFALTVYEALDFAARHRFGRLHLSVPASHAKVARGAQLSPLALVFIPTGNRPEIDPAVLRRHNHRIATQWLTSGGSGICTEADSSWSAWMLK
ncbi:peptidogalycan biosysnthesis protein [Streptomyces mirabilis]|uniref:peptidogalycan biosysnthesis protein n=1 Tax=Streptomyces mirabilis TaxID=68239 RepID=UPI0034111828